MSTREYFENCVAKEIKELGRRKAWMLLLGVSLGRLKVCYCSSSSRTMAEGVQSARFPRLGLFGKHQRMLETEIASFQPLGESPESKL